MQLIEAGIAEVRSAVITLKRAGHPLNFTLFPMIHLGAPEFYQAVALRLADCDIVVTEGVQSDSVLTRALTSVYRTMANSERLGLVVQDIDYSALAAKGIEIITPDMTAGQFDRGLRKLPWREKAAIAALAPALATAFRVFGTRRVLASYLSLDNDEPGPSGAMPALDTLIVDDRDDLLTQSLTSIAQTRGDEAITVGVVYGAEHMIAVVRGLRRLGYKAIKAYLLTVFELD
jgi:hypothetical protein